jgi:hypothetical protein
MRRVYSWFYRFLPITRVQVDDELYLLNEAEIRAVQKRERIAISLSAFIGAMGVILLYVPYYLMPHWFPQTSINLVGKTFSIPMVFLIYSAVLVVIELGLLALLNIWCAHEVAVATGFLNYENKQHGDKKNLLMDVSMEKKNKSILKYGIDPLLGLNRHVVFLWNLLFIFKATLTNFLFRLFIQRMAGRYIVRAVQDFAGIPIFAFWNAYGTHIILREARVIIMGQNLIEVYVNHLRRQPMPGKTEKSLLSDTMQFIAVNKRDFHQNHFLLTRNLFELLDIEMRKGDWNEENYLDRLKTADHHTREQCVFLIILGLVLDGSISSREKNRIRELHQLGILPFDEEQMQKITREFIQGRGIQEVWKKYMIPDPGLRMSSGRSIDP